MAVYNADSFRVPKLKNKTVPLYIYLKCLRVRMVHVGGGYYISNQIVNSRRIRREKDQEDKV